MVFDKRSENQRVPFVAAVLFCVEKSVGFGDPTTIRVWDKGLARAPKSCFLEPGDF